MTSGRQGRAGADSLRRNGEVSVLSICAAGQWLFSATDTAALCWYWFLGTNSDNGGRSEMDNYMRIHALKGTLEAARLQEIQKLALAERGTPAVPIEALRRVTVLQIALMAVREELAANEPKLGRGSEQPLD
jgi:hypothetical protein